MSLRFRVGFCLLLALGMVGIGWAHTRSHSFSDWTFEEGRVELAFWISEVEVRRLAGESPEDLGVFLEDYLRGQEQGKGRIRLELENSVCEPNAFEALPAADGFLRLGSAISCPGLDDQATGAELVVEAFVGELPDHLHFAKIRNLAGEDWSEHIFTDDRRRRALQEPSALSVFGLYLWLGVEHILIGYDHLAFLLALLILCRKPKDVIWLVTGFTVGHSLTLSLAVLGWVEPDIPVIEAFIGFSIALVALEHVARAAEAHRRLAAISAAGLGLWALVRILGGPGLPVLTLLGLGLFSGAYLLLVRDELWAERARPALTVCFGLVHGFGFASVLMDLGLAPGRLATSLFGFNLGVELGQLLVVGVLWVVGLPLLRRAPERGALWLDVLAALLCALGLYWLAQRGLAL